MTGRDLAYGAYVLGSALFLVVAVSQGSALLLAGSSLFLLGTLVLLVPDITRAHRARRGRHGASRVRWRAPTRGGAAR
ncbi:hypothetical protein OF117_04875 [Geodermatophilus sp. YIM 151500]|uniref:hypothetical protein n=1 Tax=Geodermatophilus sp. YIM 151500 TaxID=2984531 RepID=UPI0021E36A87|nr:hypothetical protein [Geodermatophilus sp. YIM 151500]MCV2488688.1 hypothetical protein [Geodermatophilus sp. YIM 151500]